MYLWRCQRLTLVAKLRVFPTVADVFFEFRNGLTGAAWPVVTGPWYACSLPASRISLRCIIDDIPAIQDTLCELKSTDKDV